MKKKFLGCLLLLVNTVHPLDRSYKAQIQLRGVDIQDTGDKQTILQVLRNQQSYKLTLPLMNDKIIALVHDYVTLTCLSLSDEFDINYITQMQFALHDKFLYRRNIER